jgi:HPt (histidine-containing phosphotransfer) domain-containing protein
MPAMIDHDRLTALRADIGDDDFADVVLMFMAEIGERLDTLRDLAGGASEDDFHFLRGCAANLGFSGMVDSCLAAEDACRAGRAPDIAAVQAAFAGALALLSPDLPGIASAA